MKKIILIITGIMLTAMLAGCGTGEDSAEVYFIEGDFYGKVINDENDALDAVYSVIKELGGDDNTVLEPESIAMDVFRIIGGYPGIVVGADKILEIIPLVPKPKGGLIVQSLLMLIRHRFDRNRFLVQKVVYIAHSLSSLLEINERK